MAKKIVIVDVEETLEDKVKKYKRRFHIMSFLALFLVLGLILNEINSTKNKTHATNNIDDSNINIEEEINTSNAYQVLSNISSNSDTSKNIGSVVTNVKSASIDKIFNSSKKNKENVNMNNSFNNDTFDVISKNIKTGNTSMYKVGDIKKIKMTVNGKVREYSLRLINNSIDSKCNSSDFSQTACGFVVEFTDVIDLVSMNKKLSNINGWKDSDLRKYLNNSLYNILPNDLKNNIIDTRVISGYGYDDYEDIITTDKLYIPVVMEVLGVDDTTDSCDSKTRQFDYYKDNLDDIKYAFKKYNGSYISYWSRSATINSSNEFNSITTGNGFVASVMSDEKIGVSPIFRIG